jgi:C4-type Zn-finger protein
MKPQHKSPELPLCPTCAKSMMLARTCAHLGGLLEMITFECKRCSIVFTEVDTGEGPVPERVIALHDEPYHTLQ